MTPRTISPFSVRPYDVVWCGGVHIRMSKWRWICRCSLGFGLAKTSDPLGMGRNIFSNDDLPHLCVRHMDDYDMI